MQNKSLGLKFNINIKYGGINLPHSIKPHKMSLWLKFEIKPRKMMKSKSLKKIKVSKPWITKSKTSKLKH